MIRQKIKQSDKVIKRWQKVSTMIEKYPKHKKNPLKKIYSKRLHRNIFRYKIEFFPSKSYKAYANISEIYDVTNTIRNWCAESCEAKCRIDYRKFKVFQGTKKYAIDRDHIECLWLEEEDDLIVLKLEHSNLIYKMYEVVVID